MSIKSSSTRQEANSRVQTITEKFETLITSQRQHQQIIPHNSVHILPVRSELEQEIQRSIDCSVKDDAKRGIKRSQAFRRNVSQNESVKVGNVATASNQNLNHSDSIRKALSKPLPEGPPPEKPPRVKNQVRNIAKTKSIEIENESQHYEDVDMLIEVAFQDPKMGQEHIPTFEQISGKHPVSEEHRKRIRRLSKCAELNSYTQQYGTIRVYDGARSDESSASHNIKAAAAEKIDTKGSIQHYNKLCNVESSVLTSKKMFNYCILVGYDMMHNKPYIKSKYPPWKLPHKLIEVFVYPDNGNLVRRQDQEYCIIITEYPHRLYGFCRRVLPESSEFCIPLTYCFVTIHNEPSVFYKLLQCIESQHGNGALAEQLIQKLYNQMLPLAGESLILTLPDEFEIHPLLHRAELMTLALTINRPKDLRLERTELYDVFNCLGPDGLIDVFESLLLEKTVILFSGNLSLLTSCVQGLLLMLYPFKWQHILITIIPDHLQQILESPVPMLAGTLQPIPEQLWKSGSTCFVNLDRRIIRSSKKEQCSILPSELKKPLRVSLELVKLFEDSKTLASVLIGGAFIRFFVELFSNLDTYCYEKSQFLNKFENPETRLFLSCFLETVMFLDFLECWHSSKLVSDQFTYSFSSDYHLFNCKITEKSQNKYWHSTTFDEVLTNSKLIERKGKTIMAKVKNLMKNK